MNEQIDATNDYALAKVLNEQVTAIILTIVVADSAGLPEDFDIKGLNSAYVLLVDELETIYDRNQKLAAIKPEPIWKQFDVIKTSGWDINEYLSDGFNDAGQSHNARVEKLCIIAGIESPSLSSEQKKLLELAELLTKNYFRIIDETNISNKLAKENDWQIPEYRLVYKLDGTILINDVLKLKKAHAGSITERLLEQAVKTPHTLFKPDLGQTSRNLSTVLHSAGFTEEIRKLFFPTVSKSKGIVFRHTITREQADADKIDTSKLDLKLKELGASTEPKTP